MKLKLFPIFIGLIVAGMASAIALLEFDKSRLRRQLDPLERTAAKAASLRKDNARNRVLLAQLKTNREEGAKAIHQDLIATQAELAALEAKASQASASTDAMPSVDTNRDPTKGLTRPEYLANVGRATPEAAFQTLIWAAMKGREPEMTACFALDPEAKAKVEALLANWTADVRAKYKTPEQFVGLAFSNGLLEASALQFNTRSVASDGNHAVLALTARVNGREASSSIPMVRSADGWQMDISGKSIDAIRTQLSGQAPKP